MNPFSNVSHDLSNGIGLVLGDFLTHSGNDQITLSSEELNCIAGQLTLLQGLAVSMEHELAVHRLGEAGGVALVLEQLAAENQKRLSAGVNGNVLTPNFGRKP